jgi:hypothetical protein
MSEADLTFCEPGREMRGALDKDDYDIVIMALLNSEWVGYPAYGLSEVKSSFPAIRKITVRMVAKRV